VKEKIALGKVEMRKRPKTSCLVLTAITFLSACNSINYFNVKETKSAIGLPLAPVDVNTSAGEPVSDDIDFLVIAKSSDTILKKIQELPALRASEAQLINKILEVDVIEIQKGPNVSLSSDVGVQTDGLTPASGGVVRINGTKSFLDSGRANTQTLLAKLAVEGAKINYINQLNETFYEVLNAVLEDQYADELYAHLQKNQLEYQKNKELIEVAAQNGIITSFDLLTLNEKIVGLERRELEIKRLKEKSKNTFTKLSLNVKREIAVPFSYSQVLDFINSNKYKYNLAILTSQNQIRIEELVVKQEKLEKKLNSNFAASISQEMRSSSTPDIFAGIQVTLPMFDNGKVDQKVSIAENNLDESKFELEFQKLELESEIQLWAEGVDLHEATMDSINEEIHIAKLKIIEMEKMLTIGRLTLNEVVTEKLGLAALIMSKIDTEYQYNFSVLQLLRATNTLCQIWGDCASFNPKNVKFK
jgi:outer membrane protein TolC